MSKRVMVSLLSVLAVGALGCSSSFRNLSAIPNDIYTAVTQLTSSPSTEPEPLPVGTTGSYFKIGQSMGKVDESYPAPNIQDYAWSTGKARFKMVPGTSLVIGSESFIQFTDKAGPVITTFPSLDTTCYQWNSGSACFQVAAGTGSPRLALPQ